MTEGRKRAVPSQSLKRLSLPYRVITIYIVGNRRFDDEKSTVNPTHFIVRLFVKTGHAFTAVNIQDAKPAW